MVKAAKKGVKRNRVSFSLEPAYDAKLKQIAAMGRRTATQELRLMIDQRALALGIAPVNPVVTNEQQPPI